MQLECWVENATWLGYCGQCRDKYLTDRPNFLLTPDVSLWGNIEWCAGCRVSFFDPQLNLGIPCA